ncbi:MAG: hypothetical protein IJI49_05400 [Bacilli bacterium]|nr:hypothetical protein [Bacilli bacterium]
MNLLVKGSIFPSVEALDELNVKYICHKDYVLIRLPQITKVGKNYDNKYLKDKNTPYYYGELLRNYSQSEDNSLENLIVINHKIVASGNIKNDKRDKELLICEGALRLYKQLFTTFSLINAGEIGGEDLANYYEAMLKDSETTQKVKSR